MVIKILKKVRSNYLGYKIGRKILSFPFIINNYFYNKLYDKKIFKTINKFENGKSPIGLDIGVTNLCNAHCIMCPHDRLKNLGTMNWKLYKKIIDNCKRLGIKEVTLSFFGEPLLDKNLIEKIEYAKKNEIRTVFYSNGSLLNSEWAKKIINSGLDEITISFDGATKKTYEKIRKGLKFETTEINVKNLLEMRKKFPICKLRINLVLVELEENKNEINNFYKKWKGKVDSINIINMRNWANDISKKGTKESFHFNKNIKRKPCALIWQRMIVDWNCDVVLCCDDWNHSTILGNLNKQTIEQVWNGPILRKIQELHKKGDFSEIPICVGCNKKSIWWLIG